MGREIRLLVALLLALSLASRCCAGPYPPHPERVYGHAKHHIEGDSLIISYDLKILDNPELVTLGAHWKCPDGYHEGFAGLRFPIVIYSKDEGNSVAQRSSSVVATRGGLLLKGKVAVPRLKDCDPAGCSLKVTGHVDTTAWLEIKRVDFEHSLTISLSYPPSIGIAWYKSTLESAGTKRGVAFAGDAFIDVDFHRLRFESSYGVSLGGDFRVREGVPISCRYYFGTEADFRPSVSAALKHSILFARKDGVEFSLDRWGAEGGLAIEGPFERLSYSYSTALGGYHKAGIYLAFFNRGAVRIGTRYEYYRFENTDMVRVILLWEGISEEELTMSGWLTDLERVDNRPWWHKGLAYVGAAPFLGIAEVLKLFGVH